MRCGFSRQSDGSYIIKNFSTGKVIDAYGRGIENCTNVFTIIKGFHLQSKRNIVIDFEIMNFMEVSCRKL